MVTGSGVFHFLKGKHDFMKVTGKDNTKINMKKFKFQQF